MNYRLDIEKYFTRINYFSSPKVDLQTLRQIHKAHLHNIPFENLNIYYGQKIFLDEKYFFDKIINKKRGGFCYELNGLFYFLLKEIGFDARLISARVFNKDGKPGKDFDHMAVIVKLDDFYLCDVGFGNSFIFPLKLENETEPIHYQNYFRVNKINEKQFNLVQKLNDAKSINHYTFSLQKRSLKDFEKMCIYNQTSPESSFTQKRICTRFTQNGRITLSDLKLIETIDGFKTETLLNSEREFESALKLYFNIDINSYKNPSLT